MITVDFTGTPLSGEDPLTVAFTSSVEIPGKRRHVRIRRADFSTQGAYELALKMASVEAGMAFLPAPVQIQPEPKRARIGTIPVNKSLSLDSEIRMVEAQERQRRQAEEKADMEMVLSMVRVIEEQWTSSAF